MIPEKFLNIKLSHFDYLLPEERIAQNPLEKRDQSKLLVYQKGEITNHVFNEIPELLPVNSQLVLNNAKVIPARLSFYRATGAKIEVFLLEPESPFTQMELALRVTVKCIWQCMIGNLKRWKDDEILTLKLNDCILFLLARFLKKYKYGLLSEFNSCSLFKLKDSVSIIDNKVPKQVELKLPQLKKIELPKKPV